MSAHVLLNLLNDLRKKRSLFTTHLINSIIQEHKMIDSIYHMTLKFLKSLVMA